MAKQPETVEEKALRLDNALKEAQLAATNEERKRLAESDTLDRQLKETQLKKLNEPKLPLYKDYTELFKVIGAACGLAAALILAFIQIVNGTLTAESVSLRRDKEILVSENAKLKQDKDKIEVDSQQLKREITGLQDDKQQLQFRKDELDKEVSDAAYTKMRLVGFIPEVSRIPEDLLNTSVDGINKDPKKWVTELVSDSHLLLMTFSAACGELKPARDHLAQAETFDSGDTSPAQFNEWRHDLDLIEEDLRRTKAGPSC
ncbi:hypothetical protein AB9E15_31015 [Rhizobium leguminosarum]|uniref:hypothetical protein n=1 Tax=Rhizobium leguminosarum TaxID=384 RepID=UPI003F975A52